MSRAAIRAYWSRVAARGCIVHGAGCAPQIAHVIGKPGVGERVLEPKPKGRKIQRHDWLVLPLCERVHHMLDNSPTDFVRCFGSPADLVDQLCRELRVDAWALSQVGRK